MEGRNQRNSRRRRQQLSRTLAAAAVVVLAGGLCCQIVVRVQMSTQARKIAAIESEIRELDASAKNLGLCIDQHHNLETIENRARELGMEQPVEDQLRLVNLPSISGDTSTQTVDSGESGSVSG